MENNWFNNVFLQSLFDRTEPLKSLWLTAKQTRICVQNLEWHCTKDCNGAHEWYTGFWNGRTVEFNYSKKNNCGNIVFGRNAEEQAAADKAAAEESKQFENELLESRINAINAGNQRIINGTIRDYKKYSDAVAEMQEDIANGLYDETEPCYIDAKKQLAFFTAVMQATGMLTESSEETTTTDAESTNSETEHDEPEETHFFDFGSFDAFVTDARAAEIAQDMANKSGKIVEYVREFDGEVLHAHPENAESVQTTQANPGKPNTYREIIDMIIYTGGTNAEISGICSEIDRAFQHEKPG